MLPTIDNNDYPKFVADQVLTAAALNDMFGYLDEQERLTRADLLGVGIVCGMHVIRHGAAIEITKGCGITSEGYLVVEADHADDVAYSILPSPVKYTGYKSFNALKPKYYEKFVDNSDPNNLKQTELWELFPSSVTDATPLTDSFLSNKAVLIFVELREENNKNCDPDSCDDKGTKVIVTLRKLLIKLADADKLMTGTSYVSGGTYVTPLPTLHKRFDVVATELASTTDIFEAYQRALDAATLMGMEGQLTQAWNTFKPLIIDLYPSNPFAGLASQFNFIFDGTVTRNQLLNFQYYYDFFNDLREAYAELRETGVQIIGQCVPENLFPRHLLLGEATGTTEETFSDYRNYFTPSPILERQHHLVQEFRFLFKKIKLMMNNFIKLASQQDTPIRITPSLLGDYPLSSKAIPFYYKVMDGSSPNYLYNFWNYKKSKQNFAKFNLSYHAGTTYNTTDDVVKQPLLYDLEPFNFLRIEGIVGKNYEYVLDNLLEQRSTNRLPFQVVALGTDARALWDLIKRKPSKEEIRELVKSADKDDIIDCHFQDLESLYDALVAELTCSLCKEMRYYYSLPLPSATGGSTGNLIPTISLLKKCDPGFRYATQTVGQLFETFYATWKNEQDSGTFTFSAALAGTAAASAETLLPLVMFRMQRLYETLADNLNEFDSDAFGNRYEFLVSTASSIANSQSPKVPGEIKDHLDSLIYTCRKAGIRSIMEEYQRRVAYVFALKKLGYFVKKHPGIQHKAGVPMGGTFILVYHEKRKTTSGVKTGNFTLRGTVVNDGTLLHAVMIWIKETYQYTVTDPAGNFIIHTNKLPVTLVVVLVGWDTKEFVINDVHDADTLDLSASGSKSEQPDLGDFLSEFSDPTSDNAVITNLSNEISEGTVIADFYLPYSCCSDCPPIISAPGHETTTPTQVTISLEPEATTGANEYCVKDERQYAFTVSPTGGVVTGPAGVGNVGGVYKFQPSLTSAFLGGRPQRSLRFTYTKDGLTATTDAIVYNMPDASFSFFPTSSPTSFIFIPNGSFGETYSWDFGGGKTSTQRNPVFDFGREGSFEVRLIVTNGPCKKEGRETVKITKPQTKTCSPVGPIIENYKGMDGVPKYNDLKPSINSLPTFDELINDFVPLMNGAVQPQIDFLDVRRAEEIIIKVVGELAEVIINNKDLRLPALMLFSIVARFTMYIACIQGQDVDDHAKVPTLDIFRFIREVMDRITPILNQFKPEEKQVLKGLRTAFQTELTRLRDSGENAIKTLYEELLQKIVDVMNAMAL